MKVAILGTRGVPANYGGFETLAEELGRRLVDRGHEVTVYGRRGFIDPSLKTYRGMRLVVLPSIRTKHLETVSHSFLSAVHAAFARYDAVLLCNAANALFIPILRWTGIPVVINVDGLERKRRKWGAAGRTYYRLGERLAAWLPNRLITDARVIQRYYSRFYHRPSEMIAYGGDLEPPRGRRPWTASVSNLKPTFCMFRASSPRITPIECSRPGRGWRVIGGWSWSAARPTPPISTDGSTSSPTTVCCCPGRSTATATASCSSTAAPMSTPPRSEGRTRRWSRPWAPAGRCCTMTRRRIARSPPAPVSASDSQEARAWSERWASCSTTGRDSPSSVKRAGLGWPSDTAGRSVADAYEEVLQSLC